MYWVLLYDVVDDYLDRRAEFRPEHLGLAESARARGELVMAGAVGEPIDAALLVFNANDASVAEAFANADPYVRNGLVASWRVQPWHVVVGGEAP